MDGARQATKLIASCYTSQEIFTSHTSADLCASLHVSTRSSDQRNRVQRFVENLMRTIWVLLTVCFFSIGVVLSCSLPEIWSQYTLQGPVNIPKLTRKSNQRQSKGTLCPSKGRFWMQKCRTEARHINMLRVPCSGSTFWGSNIFRRGPK